MKNIISLIIVVITFYTSIYAQKREILKPELNTLLTREIGEALVTSGEIINTEGVKIIESFEVKCGFIKFQHLEGNFYPLVSIKKGLKRYYSQENSKDGKYWGIGINEENSEDKNPILISMIGVVAKIKNYEIQNKVKETTQVTLCTDCLRQEFIFNGKKGSIVNFAYREFYGNIARPSFFQNLEYDIEESNIIGFKGLRLRILKTTNTSIDYEILDSFTPLN